MKDRKLRGLIYEKYGKLSAFAEAMNIAPSTLSLRLKGKSDWKRAEIERACRLLDIAAEDIPTYFFNL